MVIGRADILPLPIMAVVSSSQGALAAAGEATISVSPPGTIGAFPLGGFAFATVQPAAAESGVQYVAEITAISSSTITVKVKNVGATASAQTWVCNVLYFDPGIIPH